MKTLGTRMCTVNGFTLLEVLIGMVVFALGIMALAQLQGNLSKASADSNTRSVAINIAEEAVERARSFSQITAGADVNAFNNIVSKTGSVQVGGIDYSIVHNVTDYYFNPATDTFSTTKPDSSIGAADMKGLSLTVSWGGNQNYQIDETHTTSSLGSGSITLNDIISSITSPSGGKVVLNATTSSLYGPPVDYSPGENPDIVSIQLGENRFKESTSPLPTVFNANERVETKFDVVTYSQSEEGASFLRREEFIAVACECTLRFATSDDEGGLRPTLWNGNEYTEGEFVRKPYGEANRENNVNYQSQYCGLCCRDHHDGGSGEQDVGLDSGRSKFDPFRNGSQYWSSGDGVSALTGDHKHYGLGGIGIADSDGDTYVEACRLVRKDGFFRVAQDLRQEGLNSFPQDHLDEESEVTEYSNYVTDATTQYLSGVGDNYESAPPAYPTAADMLTAVVFPGSTLATASEMGPSLGSQQLRARGIYLDYMTDELRVIIDCLNDGNPGSACGVPGSNSALEIVPFYDVQLTWLSRWTENPANFPIDVTNDEAIQTGNTHDRGRAELTSGSGSTQIFTRVHNGNLGLTGSDPIDPSYNSGLSSYTMYANANSETTPPPTAGTLVNGSITSTFGPVKAADVEIEGQNGAICNRTNTGFSCTATTGSAILKVGNYFKLNKFTVACSNTLTLFEAHHISSTDNSQNYTRFILPGSGPDINNADIYIKQGTSCP